MEREQIDKIFDPFFTTKEVAKGTGLGPATVYGIVKQHDRMIQAYSEVGKGMMFTIYLLEVGRRAVQITNSVSGPVVGGTETILLVEDDETILELTTRILSDAGYTVLVAKDGEEAVRLFEQFSDAIDLALCDVVMPKLGGEEAIERILRKRPSLRYICFQLCLLRRSYLLFEIALLAGKLLLLYLL